MIQRQQNYQIYSGFNRRIADSRVMPFVKIRFIFLLLLCALFVLPSLGYADKIEGQTVITLGDNLTQNQKNSLLTEFGNPNAEVIIVTNKEEHEALADLLPTKVIGNKSISSSMMTIKEPGYGIQVKTNNITWVSADMYAQALATAGIEDADVQVSAPFPVSGTAALTGIMKAFETATNTKISEDQKKTATEEMVLTAQLAEQTGDREKVLELIQQFKAKLADQKLTEEQMSIAIDEIAAQIGLNLSPEEKQSLISLGLKLQELNIDWEKVVIQGEKLLNQAKVFLDQNPETKSWFMSIWESIKSWIDSFFSSK